MSTPDPGQLVAQRYSVGAKRACVSIVPVWHLGFDLPATIGGWADYRWPWAVAVAWVAYAVIGGLASWALLADRRFPSWAGPAGAVGAIAISATVIAACHPDDVLEAANWGWGSVGWLGMVLCWRSKVWAWNLSAFLAANAGTALAGLIATGAVQQSSVSRFLVVLVGSITLQMGGSVGGHALDMAARLAVASSSELAEAQAARAAAAQVHADRLKRYAQVREVAASVLTDLAAGADPMDPGVRHECAVGAARLRRLISETDDAPNPLLHTLRACAFDVERRGVVVTLATAGTIPPLSLEKRRALMEAPLEALARARTQARVTLMGMAGEVILSVVTDAEEFAVPAPEGVAVATQTEGGLLWTESRLTTTP